MNRRTVSIIFVVIVLVLAVFYLSRRESIAPTINESLASPTPLATLRPTPIGTATLSPAGGGEGRSPQTFTISFLEGSTLSMSVLTVKTGDTVTFINKDLRPHWPAAGIHPVHNICPTFDSKRGLQTGESYSHIFSQATTCPFHDHLNAGSSSLDGQIIVTQ